MFGNFNFVGSFTGSNQPIWESEEDGRRHYIGLRQEQRSVSSDDLEVCAFPQENRLLVFKCLNTCEL